MRKRLWQIVGPLVTALLFLVLFFAVYPSQIRYDLVAEKQDALALTDLSFKSRFKKERALTDPTQRFVPFFGSSEWLRFDSMHPSVLAEAYDRPYRPYLIGQRGAASLSQLLGMQQVVGSLEKSQAVYVVSPQWFTKEGADPAAFQKYFSSDQVISFLTHQELSLYSQHAAQRLLELKPGGAFSSLLKRLANQEPLSSQDQVYLAFQSQLVGKQDRVFGQWGSSKTNVQLVDQLAAKLPTTFSYQALEAVAESEAKRATTGNDFLIDKDFYNQRIRPKLAKLKGSQRHFSYLTSPEYQDLQLVLAEFARLETSVLFVIPPINQRWIDYTGLDKAMYRQTVAKIKHQLESQGFTHIADLSEYGDKEYFMQDTIHMGFKGWLELDKSIAPFLTTPYVAPSYQLDTRFLSQEWADYTGNLADWD